MRSGSADADARPARRPNGSGGHVIETLRQARGPPIFLVFEARLVDC